MFEDTLACFKAKVQSVKQRIALLELVDHAQALEIVFKPARIRCKLAHTGVELILTRVAKWRMPQVVRQGNRFSQVFIQPQAAGQHARDLSDLQGVRQPGTKQVALVVDEHLRLVFQPTKSPGMDNAIAVTLERVAVARCGFGVTPPTALAGTTGVSSQFSHGQVLKPYCVQSRGRPARPGPCAGWLRQFGASARN